MSIRIFLLLFFVFLFAFSSPALAEEPASTQAPPDEPYRGIVRGGIYDKPFMFTAGNTRFGGYADLQYRAEREEGFTDQATFLANRFNIFVFAPVGDRVRLAAELEFEDGGRDILLELAVLDFEIHPALIARVGMILSPLGKFNLAHDAPAHHHVDRPFVSTQIIPATLSEPGAGFYGALPLWDDGAMTYEIYAVNGFHDGLITGDGGTRFAAGKANFTDNNTIPSLTGRLALQPLAGLELAISGHVGPYNTVQMEDHIIDDLRLASIVALDGEWRFHDFELRFEAARAHVDVPDAFQAVAARYQHGYYGEFAWRFLKGVFATLPDSEFAASLRHDFIDLDTKIGGDDTHALTLGLSFRPVSDTVFKVDYRRGITRDRFQNPEHQAALLFGGATYF